MEIFRIFSGCFFFFGYDDQLIYHKAQSIYGGKWNSKKVQKCKEMQPDLESISAGGSYCPAEWHNEMTHRHRACRRLRATIRFNQSRT